MCVNYNVLITFSIPTLKLISFIPHIMITLLIMARRQFYMWVLSFESLWDFPLLWKPGFHAELGPWPRNLWPHALSHFNVCGSIYFSFQWLLTRMLPRSWAMIGPGLWGGLDLCDCTFKTHKMKARTEKGVESTLDLLGYFSQNLRSYFWVENGLCPCWQVTGFCTSLPLSTIGLS